MDLKDKNILVGITGSIAAYKAVYLVSSLKSENANVNVVMTENAAKFVTPLTFQTLSQNKVYVNMFEEKVDWKIEHISLADKSDLIVVVPASANIIGKIANGIADDLLSTVIMSCKSPVLFAPAMNVNMYENPIVQSNIKKLEKSGYFFVGPDTGKLACGTIGKGRLTETDKIIEKIKQLLNKVGR
ncbi:MAG: bifunctional phosphopantothenoylcysteine decarboxylase/phosphopantothenate--cysteine ligase CoaBC [Candidatus Firestonebacteria bacterium]